jgi:peroxiredoxin
MKTAALILLSACALFAADVPRRAPGFALPDYKGEIHDLADYRGKVVVIEFMQSICPHCAGFADKLNEVQRKYGDKVAVLAVGNPPADNPSTLAKYAAGHQALYPVLFDCGQMAYSYVKSPTIDLPMVFLIDGGGTIRKQFGYGPLTKDLFEGNGLAAEIDRLLAAGGTSKSGKK